jgi:hypothetical protein
MTMVGLHDPYSFFTSTTSTWNQVFSRETLSRDSNRFSATFPGYQSSISLLLLCLLIVVVDLLSRAFAPQGPLAAVSAQPISIHDWSEQKADVL